MSSRANVTDIADAVCQILIDARCGMVIVEGLHTINVASHGG